jgi:hypothetical protein
VVLVFRDIYYQLLAELPRRDSWPRHFDLYNRVNFGQKKIHARRRCFGGITWKREPGRR